MELDVNGRFHLPGREEQIAFFEKFLEAIQAGHGAVFTQTDRCLELEVCEENDLDDRERQRWIKLLRRTLLILREGLGVLVATKTGSRYFEFWVECSVDRGLPSHRWISWGALYTPELKNLAAEEFGLTGFSSL